MRLKDFIEIKLLVLGIGTFKGYVLYSMPYLKNPMSQFSPLLPFSFLHVDVAVMKYSGKTSKEEKSRMTHVV